MSPIKLLNIFSRSEKISGGLLAFAFFTVWLLNATIFSCWHPKLWLVLKAWFRCFRKMGSHAIVGFCGAWSMNREFTRLASTWLRLHGPIDLLLTTDEVKLWSGSGTVSPEIITSEPREVR